MCLFKRMFQLPSRLTRGSCNYNASYCQSIPFSTDPLKKLASSMTWVHSLNSKSTCKWRAVKFREGRLEGQFGTRKFREKPGKRPRFVYRSVHFLPHLLGHFEGIWIFILSTIWRIQLHWSYEIPNVFEFIKQNVFLVDVPFLFESDRFQTRFKLEGFKRKPITRHQSSLPFHITGRQLSRQGNTSKSASRLVFFLVIFLVFLVLLVILLVLSHELWMV